MLQTFYVHRKSGKKLCVVLMSIIIAACGGDAGSGANQNSGNSSSSSGHVTPVVQPTTLPDKASPIRRLTHAEYNNTVRDLTGANSYGGSFPAEALHHGLTDDAASLSVATLLATSYIDSASDIAKDALANFQQFTGCDANPTRACIENFIKNFGGKAFRRPITSQEISKYTDFYQQFSDLQGISEGVSAVVEAMLISPHFLYLVEGDEAVGGELNDFEIASRLSYLVWDSMPDEALFAAAEAGKLRDSNERLAQLERMLDDPKANDAVTNLYKGWFGIRDANVLAQHMASDLSKGEQEHKRAMGFIDSWFFDNKPFSEFYTTPVSTDPAPDNTNSPDIAAGLLAMRGLVASHSEPGTLVPIERGVFTLERVLCSAPPSVEDTPDAPERSENQNNRDWLALHRANGACKTCHDFIDPYGVVYEQFDDRGRYRILDKIGKPVDASAELTTVGDVSGYVADLAEFSAEVAASDQGRECMAEVWYRTALGRTLVNSDEQYMEYLSAYWKQEGGSAKQVLKALVQSDLFINRIVR